MIGTPPLNSSSAGFKSFQAGLAVKFSPFQANTLAVAFGENFGIAGKGQLSIFNKNMTQFLVEQNVILEENAIFDCSWSEQYENLIMIGLGNGLIKLYNLAEKRPTFVGQQQKGEVYCVECNYKLANLYLSSGFDGIINLWDISQNKKLAQLMGHKGIAYQVCWHPKNDKVFASAGADALNQQKPVMELQAHAAEILTIDFNKYYEAIIATGSIDKSIHIWDMRNFSVPLLKLQQHKYPVRKIKFSPHAESILASASYDMNVAIWDMANQQQKQIILHPEHSEFVMGLDFNLFIEKQIASTSYDGRVLVWNWDQKQPII